MTNERHEVLGSSPSPEGTAGAVASAAGGQIRFITNQPPGESLARVLLGSSVQNVAGETIGDVHDIMFDREGRITSVLLGVGGFIGLGEKIVAVPFESLAVMAGATGTRALVLAVDRQGLEDAPQFIATEKTTLDSMSDLAAVLGRKAAVQAGRIKDQAVKAVEGLRK